MSRNRKNRKWHTTDQLRRGIRRLAEEGAGVWDLHVFAPEDVTRLWLAWMTDDPRGLRYWPPVRSLVQQWRENGPVDEGVLCHCCGEPLPRAEDLPVPPPIAFVLVTPHIDGPMTVATGGIVCPECCELGYDAMAKRVVEAWQELIDPSIRIIEVSDDAGHA